MTPADPALEKKALVAHLREEVSGPVEGLLGCVNALVEAGKDGNLAEFLPDIEKIQAATDQLWTMVNGLVDPSRFEFEMTTETDIDSFSYRLRHGLRTPITAIKGYGEMLLEDMEPYAWAPLPDLRQILASADHLLAVVNLLARPPRGADGGDPSKTAAGVDLADVSRLVEDVSRAIGAGPPVDLDKARITGRILLVDDSERGRDVLKQRLTRDGHTVVPAADGVTALALVREQPFDLMLLDMMMPGLTGYEVLIRIKRDPELSSLPVIMISALDDTNTVVRCSPVCSP